MSSCAKRRARVLASMPCKTCGSHNAEWHGLMDSFSPGLACWWQGAETAQRRDAVFSRLTSTLPKAMYTDIDDLFKF